MPDKFDPRYIVIVQYDSDTPTCYPFFADQYDEAREFYWEQRQNWSTVYFSTVSDPAEPLLTWKTFPNTAEE